MGNCWGSRKKEPSFQKPFPSTGGLAHAKVTGHSSSPLNPPTLPPTQEKCRPISLPTPRSESDILSSPHLKAFLYNELKNATRNFRSDSLLGEGGFGYVYKGWIDVQTLAAAKPGAGIVVAVKKLKPGGFQGHKEWLSEVNYLGQLHHPNLVKLIGYCLNGDNQLLAYEYMPKGSLENHLFRRGARPLSWAIRMKVAIGAARGLSFLHELEQQIIYRDFKASNILLDAEYNSKLSDFGLAKESPTGDRTHVSTQVMGTQGYAAPEYVATDRSKAYTSHSKHTLVIALIKQSSWHKHRMHNIPSGRLTSRCDVYSFGVVLLELLSGRRAVDKTKAGIEKNLVEWARPYLGDKRKLFGIMDTKLEGQYPQKGAFMAAILAFESLSEAKIRPTMTEVLTRLENIPVPKDASNSVRSNHRSATQNQSVSPALKSPLK